MKKKMKKLVLAKETIRGLDSLSLGRIAGGVEYEQETFQAEISDTRFLQCWTSLGCPWP
jgi:hypothetical protein